MQKNQQSFKRKIFGLDNKVMRVSAKIFDLMFLNLSFVVSCLAIVTIGPAIVTLYRMATKVREESNVNIGREYWKELKGNWTQGISLGFLGIFVASSIYLNSQIFSGIQQPLSTFLQIVSYGIGFISLVTGLYAFQISSQFNSSLKQVIKNAFLLSFLNFSKTIQLLIPILGIVFLLIYSSLTMLLTWSILLFIGFSGIAYVQTKTIQPIFKKYRQNITHLKERNWIDER